MGDVRIEYPCGMKLWVDTIGFYLDYDELRLIYDRGCPIHGKDCKRIIQQDERRK